MDPIRNKPITPPTTPPVSQPVEVAKTSTQFNVGSNTPLQGASVNPATAAQSANQASSVDSLRTHIQSAMKVSNDHASLVQNVIDRSVEARFGNLATPQLKQKVADTLSNDPNFMSMMNRLINELGGDSK